MADVPNGMPPDDSTLQRQILFAKPDITSDDIHAVTSVLLSGWLTTGDECFNLEEELSSFLSVPHVVAVSSCTAALETVAAYLGLPAGARVGVPTWTFVSSALAVTRGGAVPVLLDVEEDTLNLSASSLASALADGLDAVVAVHFAGVPVSAKVRRMCADARVPLIEDAAHALGARDDRGLVGGQGTTAACFSFYATKNLTSGEGGAVATEDERLAEFARSYRLHGLSRDAWDRYRPGATSDYDIVVPGIKANLPDLLAALARSQLRRYGDLQARRRTLVQRYRAHLAEIEALRCVPTELAEGGADHLMVVLLPKGTNRDQVVATLAEADIGSSVHFKPLSSFEWFRKNAIIGSEGTSVADSLASRALSLPLHPGLADADVDRVCGAIAGILRD